LIYLSINAKNTPTFNQIPELDQVFHKFMEIIFLEKIDDEQEYNYFKTDVLDRAFVAQADGIVYSSVGSECRG
jgi:hypothetical protein